MITPTLQRLFCRRLIQPGLPSWRCLTCLLFTLLCSWVTLTDSQPLQATALQQTMPMRIFSTTPSWSSSSNNIVFSLAWGDMNGDGALDLAVSNWSQPSMVYLNEGGLLASTPAWSSPTSDGTYSVAWGDMNGDGALDLAVGNNYLSSDNAQEFSKVYLNEGGMLASTPAWSSPTSDSTYSVAWGDMNGDGALDLAVGNDREPSKVYLNEGGMLASTPTWSSPTSDNTYSVAWGDMNGDGILDLAASNAQGPSKVYLNEGGLLASTPVWSSPTSDGAYSVAWGDMNGDGALDLAVGNGPQSNKVYLNEGGMLASTPAWSSSEGGAGYSIAWGDMNNDGALDLAVGKSVYLNEGGLLTSIPAWSSTISDFLFYVALGDMNGDGALDLAVSNFAQPSMVYLNKKGMLASTPAWSSPTGYGPYSVAWGDMNGDGALDLAVGNRYPGIGNIPQPNKVYLNEGGMLASTPAWSSPTRDSTFSVAWGDMNGDGALDLAISNFQQPSKVYLNEGGMLASTPAWSSPTSDDTYSVAWGDMNGDGALDLAVGNWSQPNKVYLNEGRLLASTPAWSSPTSETTYSVAWGDMNGDGALDLAVGNQSQPSKVYLNEGGLLASVPVWSSPKSDATFSVAWGDMNGDGALDLAVGNGSQPSKVYLNEGGMLASTPAWSSPTSESAYSVAWGDMNSDGALDLAAGKGVYLNEGRTLAGTLAWLPPTSESATYSVAWGDMNSDGALDLAIGWHLQIYLNERPAHLFHTQHGEQPELLALNHLSDSAPTWGGQVTTLLDPADFYALSTVRQSGRIPFTYQLFHPGRDPMRMVRAYYSLDGSFPADRTTWRVAKPWPGTPTTDLSTSPFPTVTITNTHVFTWDVLGSGFFGESDNVVVRLEALPTMKLRPNGVPGPFQRPFVSSQTFPFRVRGTQVRVMYAGNPAQPLKNAIVYRLPANQSRDAQPFTDRRGVAFQTNVQGYLQGYGSLQTGDQLVALWSITHTASYTLYQTSATPILNGLDTYPVNSLGVQTVTVSGANNLLLFNLTVSLEWDARNDPTFMTQLESDLKRTSQILFDATNGQAALGRVHIYHDRGFWGTANLIILANNNQRPSAIMGGMVLTGTVDVDSQGRLLPDAYVPGQVRMGATWNRFGNAGGTLGEDWPRALAHELSHFFFFQADDYIGVSPDHKLLKLVDCKGSLMTDPYDDSYSEFVNLAAWIGDCQQTLMQQYLGRSDWQTIKRFYPILDADRRNPGPNQLPLAVTTIETFAPPTATQTLAAPLFNMVDDQNKTLVLETGHGDAYLFKTQHDADPTNDYLIALGAPVGDLVQARGAAPGDRLCVFDFDHTPLRLGCLDTIGNSPSPIVLHEVPNWHPQIQVRGVSTNTVVVTVTNSLESRLMVQLLPALGAASPEMAMINQGNAFMQTVTAVDGAYYGFVRIWVPGSNPHKEMIVDYVASEAWNARARAWGPPVEAWGARARAWGVPAYAWGARALAWGVPVMSNDGQVSIFPLDNPFASDQRYMLQTLPFPPALPNWLTPVGQTYRASALTPVTNSAIIFSYLARDVPAGYENDLRIYYSPDEGHSWQRLSTELDTYRNQASATVPGAGIYLLVATLEVQPTLTTGWNLFGYSLQLSHPVDKGLASIAGSYSTVYTYDPALSPSWRLFDPTVQPPFTNAVNTLTQLEQNHGYWIYATRPVTLYLGVSSINATVASNLDQTAAPSGPAAPAVYYGWVTPTANFTPTVGQRVTGEINGVVCGETTTQMIEGKLAYVLSVKANDSNDPSITCGVLATNIVFRVGDQVMDNRQVWDNRQAWFHPLGEGQPFPISGRIYLPLIR